MQKKFGLKDSFVRRLKENDCHKPMPVQIQGIPVLFSRQSAIVLAETGSGKSLTFITPLLHMIKKGDGLRAIVLSPTRELTIQLYKEFLIYSGAGGKHQTPRVRFLRKALFPTNPEQYDKLRKSTEILIASPLKLA
jgi:ATP-dependent RNA helicase RhlE